MSERARNLAVGLTALVALGMVAAMIMLFTVVPSMFRGGYEIRMLADTSYDLEAGYPVQFAGMRVGYISDVRFTDPTDPTRGVTLIARIERQVRLPGNTNAYIFTKGFVGSPYVELESIGPPHKDPATGRPLEHLPTDGSVALEVIHKGSGMIPDDVLNALKDMQTGFKDLGTLAQNLNELMFPRATSAPGAAEPNGPAGPPPEDVRSTLAKLGRALDGMNQVLGDVENQKNLKTTLTNLAKASQDAPAVMASLKAVIAEVQQTLVKTRATIDSVGGTVDRAGKDFDQLAAKLMDSADKLAGLMTSLNQVVDKLQGTEGTAGKLLNDPQLYNSLLEITHQLDSLLKEFRVLVATWQTSGVGIKLK